MDYTPKKILLEYDSLEENKNYYLKIPKTHYPENLFLEKEFKSKSECLNFIEELISDIETNRDLVIDNAKTSRYNSRFIMDYLKEAILEDNLLESIKYLIKDLEYDKYSAKYIFLLFTN